MNEYNWSVKKLLKEIVMCATYRQDSRITKNSEEKIHSINFMQEAAGYVYRQNRCATRHFASVVC